MSWLFLLLIDWVLFGGFSFVFGYYTASVISTTYQSICWESRKSVGFGIIKVFLLCLLCCGAVTWWHGVIDGLW